MPIRALLAVALLGPLLVGSLEALVFAKTIFKPGMLDAPTAVAFGLIGIGSVPVSGWALFQVRSQRPSKIAALLLLSAAMATLGWVYVIGVAQG